MTGLLCALLFLAIGNSVSSAATLQNVTSVKATQEMVDYLANHLDVKFDVISNLIETDLYSAKVTLTNKGTQEIPNADWSIYWCNIRMVEPGRFPYRDGLDLGQSGIKVHHVVGCLFRLTPAESFKTLAPAGSVEVPMHVEYWNVARTDTMPNWYVSGDGLQPRTILCTAGDKLEFVGKHDTKEKWKRYDFDLYDPYSPQTRYDKITVDDLGGVDATRIIPTPWKTEKGNGHASLLTGDWVVLYDEGLEKMADMLAEYFPLTKATTTPSTRYITLKNATSIPGLDDLLSASMEAYNLTVSADNQVIQIHGAGTAGVFYGVQTLLALSNENQEIPAVTIMDAPRFAYRGLQLDVSRNFVKKDDIVKLLKTMGRYKLNKLHLHVTDDEGWRLEIPGLEELTSIGAKRCHDLTEKTCGLSQLGSGPSTTNSGTGYYSVNDYKEILQFAADRNIEVIPEFDMPGHAHAAIKAMEARYFRFIEEGNEIKANEFLISEINDTSLYRSRQQYTDNAINPCLPSTYNFIRHLATEVKKMHAGIQDLRIFNYGGDEVAHGAWQNSSACKDILTMDNATNLQEMFVRNVSIETAKLGLDLAGWEDGLLDDEVPYNTSFLENKHLYAYAWQNIWENGYGNRAYKLANAGYRVIMSQATHLYFDHPYEPDPEENGYYWATRFCDTQKTHSFMPDDLYANVDFKRSGESISREELCKEEGACTPLNRTENIIGMQGLLWSETVRTSSDLYYMLFPRVLALAERAWHKASWETEVNTETRNRMRAQDWSVMANLLGHRELRRLDDMGVSYRVPWPAAKIVDGMLRAKNAFPGLPLLYSRDGGATWSDYMPGVVLPPGPIQVISRSADRRRYSPAIEMNIPEVKSAAWRIAAQSAMLCACLTVARLLF